MPTSLPHTSVRSGIRTGDTMMVEADVSLGYVFGDYEETVPIMAHPPAFISELSLREFIETFLDVSQEPNQYWDHYTVDPRQRLTPLVEIGDGGRKLGCSR